MQLARRPLLPAPKSSPPPISLQPLRQDITSKSIRNRTAASHQHHCPFTFWYLPISYAKFVARLPRRTIVNSKLKGFGRALWPNSQTASLRTPSASSHPRRFSGQGNQTQKIARIAKGAPQLPRVSNSCFAASTKSARGIIDDSAREAPSDRRAL